MSTVARRTVTVEVDEVLVERLEQRGDTVSGFLDRELRRRFALATADETAAAWAAGNREALASYARFIGTNGTFSERMRRFR